MTEEEREQKNAYHLEWRKNNPEKVKEAGRRHRARNLETVRKQQRDHKRRRREEDPDFFKDYHREYHAGRKSDPRAVALGFIGRAQRRADSKGWDFDLHEHFDDMVSRIGAWRCELSGIPLKSWEDSKRFDSISIDRIDAKRGYVYSNIRVIAWGLNAAFSDWGEEQTAKLMRRWLDMRDLI